MTLERQEFVTLNVAIICGMTVCAFFMLRHTPHHSVFSLTFFGLMLISSWLQYTSNATRRTPDTLIRLFPESSATTKERP